jgi:capsid protein
MRKADIEDLRAGLITEDAIVEARGMNYSDILHKLAANAKMRQEIAAEYGIDESQLGILTKPGDIPVQVESEDDDDEEENQPNTNNENRNQ